MQKLFTTFLLIFSFTSYGQSGLWKPFKLAVIQPDTAVIDKSLHYRQRQYCSDTT
jgi:hypothetical protein